MKGDVGFLLQPNFNLNNLIKLFLEFTFICLFYIQFTFLICEIDSSLYTLNFYS